MKNFIDLRSDTVTRPTEGMRKAMYEAEVGDDVFREDPTVNAFQEEVAAMFGMESGVFVPSGTMGNQLALNVQSRPGELKSVCEPHAQHLQSIEFGCSTLPFGDINLPCCRAKRVYILRADQIETGSEP